MDFFFFLLHNEECGGMGKKVEWHICALPCTCWATQVHNNPPSCQRVLGWHRSGEVASDTSCSRWRTRWPRRGLAWAPTTDLTNPPGKKHEGWNPDLLPANGKTPNVPISPARLRHPHLTPINPPPTPQVTQSHTTLRRRASNSFPAHHSQTSNSAFYPNSLPSHPLTTLPTAVIRPTCSI